jgi:hypothetical protein
MHVRVLVVKVGTQRAHLRTIGRSSPSARLVRVSVSFFLFCLHFLSEEDAGHWRPFLLLLKMSKVSVILVKTSYNRRKFYCFRLTLKPTGSSY